jgi:hypothetical protein
MLIKMKKFLLLWVLTFPLMASAQVYPFTGSGLKLMKPDIDKVTGDTVWKTSANRIADQGSMRKPDILEYVTMKRKGHVALFIYLTKGGNKPDLFSIKKGGKMIIKFSDSTTVALHSAATDTAVLDASQKNTVLCWGIYNLDPDEVPVLKNNAVASIKIETSIGTLNYEVKEKNSTLIANQLALITGK